MAMEGLWALACASAVVLGAPPGGLYPPPTDRDSAIATTLAVQTAMQQGREYLLHRDARAAVEILEAQLSRINGNPAYLNLLREAYRLCIQEFRLNNQEPAAREYQRRLQILETGSAQKQPHGQASAETSVQASAARPPNTVRAKREDEDDPFHPGASRRIASQALLTRAEQEFSQNHFLQAAALFEQAHSAEPSAVASSAPRWAYCKLDHVVAELNRSSTAYGPLEDEVRSALQLAPRLQFANELLAEIDRRRSSPGRQQSGDGDQTSGITIHEGGPTSEGWSVAETENFRVLHRGAREMAAQAVRVAEKTRAAMQRRWFGTSGPNWGSKCEIYLHATADDYSQATHVPPTSPGHSSFQIEGGQVVGRRIDLHCDEINLLVAILPHETTHTVLAGNFGERPVPRWADEGMAVLTEPREKIDRHLRNLSQYYQDRQLFSLRQLVEMNEYPDARYVGPFYAQSVSLVEFLSAERGPQVFTQFVRDGLRNGYSTALKQHYGYESFEELQQLWVRHVFGTTSTSPGVARSGP